MLDTAHFLADLHETLREDSVLNTIQISPDLNILTPLMYLPICDFTITDESPSIKFVTTVILTVRQYVLNFIQICILHVINRSQSRGFFNNTSRGLMYSKIRYRIRSR